MIQAYNKILEKISRVSGKTEEEISRLVEAKRAKLSGLISREGAAQIIAAELGINFDKEKIKVNELLPGIKKVNILGKIIRLFPVKEYHTNNREGKIGSMILADETGNVRVVLWDTSHIDLLEKGMIKDGDVIEISNANFRNTEVHLTGFSDIKKSSEIIENVKTALDYSEKKISDLSLGGGFKIRATIVQAFEPKFFLTCPECKTKALEDVDGYKCEKHGKILPEKRSLLSIILDDGSSSIRSVLFSEQLSSLGISQEDLTQEKIQGTRTNLLGKESFFSGSVRQNKLFNTKEFFISSIEELDLDKLISNLEAKV